MVFYSTTIENKEKLVRLQQFIKAELPSIRFRANPIEFSNGKFDVSLMGNVEDFNKLHSLENQWYEMDKKKTERSNWFNRLISKLKFILD